jgi:hypothetical protein
VLGIGAANSGISSNVQIQNDLPEQWMIPDLDGIGQLSRKGFEILGQLSRIHQYSRI